MKYNSGFKTKNIVKTFAYGVIMSFFFMCSFTQFTCAEEEINVESDTTEVKEEIVETIENPTEPTPIIEENISELGIEIEVVVDTTTLEEPTPIVTEISEDESNEEIPLNNEEEQITVETESQEDAEPPINEPVEIDTEEVVDSENDLESVEDVDLVENNTEQEILEDIDLVETTEEISITNEESEVVTPEAKEFLVEQINEEEKETEIIKEMPAIEEDEIVEVVDEEVIENELEDALKKHLVWEKDAKGKSYWYENNKRQGVKGDKKNIWDLTYDKLERGREIFDPSSDAWYWLDARYNGAKAESKEVWMPYIYQDEKAGSTLGKWVRYDENGAMIKGWYLNDNGLYYYDPITGAMYKGNFNIEGVNYHFNEATGIMDTQPDFEEMENAYQAKLERVIKELRIDNASDYEKCVRIFDYIDKNVQYNYPSYEQKTEHSRSYYSFFGGKAWFTNLENGALLQGYAVCAGYAGLFNDMAKKVGLDTGIFHGNTVNGGHSWNTVKLDGKYYQCDATWGDRYFLRGTEYFENNDHVFYTKEKDFSTTDYNKGINLVHPIIVDIEEITFFDTKTNTAYINARIKGKVSHYGLSVNTKNPYKLLGKHKMTVKYVYGRDANWDSILNNLVQKLAK